MMRRHHAFREQIMTPFLSLAAVAAAVSALAAAPILSQPQPHGPDVYAKPHKKSHIRPRSGQRPADWRAAPPDQAASASSAAQSSAEASGAANSPTPYPPTLRPANFYARDANGTGGKTAYPDPNVDRSPGVAPLPEQPVADPLCAPRTGATATQPSCPLPTTQSSTSATSSTGSADSHAPDR
jgi:hypothetical protein